MLRSRKGSALLALVLIAAGVGFVLFGARGLWKSADLGAWQPSATTAALAAMPRPTLTEPILPPPPTATGLSIATRQPPTHSAEPTLPSGPSPSHTSPPDASTAPAPAWTSTLAPTLATITAPIPTAAPTNTVLPTVSATLRPTASPAATPAHALYTLRQRVGVCGVPSSTARDRADQLGFGWYLDWQAVAGESRPLGVDYVPMIRLMDGEIRPDGEALLAVVDALPGAVWLIGNEPDVKWQDNVTPEAYVQAYHDLYALLKGWDPTCQVAIGGVSQPTPLRLRYLDRILELYQAHYGEPMPVDVWNVHNFVLREERDSWGVDVPPGMPDRTGRLREIADHDDLGIFQQQIVDFRRWMMERGQQDKPLIVTEYGILMPADYGFPPEKVEQFMLDTFEFFRTAADPALGYPADGHRLVQRWCWYSLADERYPTGNLMQAPSGELTPLGVAYSEYARSAH